MRISDWSSDVCSSDLLRLGLDQRQRRQHDLLARARDFLRERDLVGGAQFAALAAHRLAQVDDVDRPVRGFAVEGQGPIAWPVVLQGTEAVLYHGCLQCPDRKSTRLNSSHYCAHRMPSYACK